jgi:hypothetical protein
VQRQIIWKDSPVSSWAEFHRCVKQRGKQLLEHLDDFGSSNVLVAGCQRSGTTALTHLLGRAQGMADYAFGRDSELDGALLLAGRVARFTGGRHCFQTTYLNDRFAEYFLHRSFRLIWIIREPHSVVYSMLHNWKRGALNRLYDACGSAKLDLLHSGAWVFDRWRSPSRLEKACASYVAKTEQAFVLHRQLGDRMLIIDYDDLVSSPEPALRRICDFIEIPFDRELGTHLHTHSIRRGSRLPAWQAERVDNVCMSVYRFASELRPEVGHA